jgi:hypothetical protein
MYKPYYYSLPRGYCLLPLVTSSLPVVQSYLGSQLLTTRRLQTLLREINSPPSLISIVIVIIREYPIFAQIRALYSLLLFFTIAPHNSDNTKINPISTPNEDAFAVPNHSSGLGSLAHGIFCKFESCMHFCDMI